MCRSCSLRSQNGFTYVALLFAVAAFAAGSATFLQYWSEDARRERERELLATGREFVDAIGSFYEGTPGAAKSFPATLDQLVQDPRFVGTRRHLRRAYKDPITLSDAWGVVKAPDGGIMGVYSLSEAAPRRQTDFPVWVQVTAGARRYSDWKFVYVPTRRN